jgi:pectate lyase
MTFRSRIYFPSFLGNSPTVPTVEEAAGGWGDLHPDGSITGGNGGDTLFFNESSSVNGQTGFDALWETIKLNLETPLKLIWTGGNIELDPVNYTIGSSSNTFVGKPVNKEIRANAGQTIRGGSFIFQGWRNTIWRNIVRKGDGLGGDNSPIHAGKGITLRYCFRFWVDHCEFDGEATVPGTELIKDGSLDMGRESDFNTISNTYLHRSSKTTLIVGNNTSIENSGKNRTTFRNCRWENNHIRQPFARFGKIHFLQNLFQYDPQFINSSDQYDWATIGELGIEAQIIYEDSFLDTHRYCFIDRDPDPLTAISGIKSVNCVFGPQWIGEASNRWNNSINGLRPQNAIFDPWDIVGYNYPLGSMTPQQAKDYALQWAGAKYHLKNPIL